MWSVKMRSPRSGVPADPTRLTSSQKGDIRTRTHAHGEDIGEAGGDAAAAEELPGGSRGRGDGPLTSDLRPPDGEAAPFCGRSPAECVTRRSSRGRAEGTRCGMNAEARLASARRAGPWSDAPPVPRRWPCRVQWGARSRGAFSFQSPARHGAIQFLLALVACTPPGAAQHELAGVPGKHTQET